MALHDFASGVRLWHVDEFQFFLVKSYSVYDVWRWELGTELVPGCNVLGYALSSEPLGGVARAAMSYVVGCSCAASMEASL